LSCHHTATSEIYPLSLHDALPIYLNGEERVREELEPRAGTWLSQGIASAAADFEDRLRATETRALTPNQEDQLASFGLRSRAKRSEEHTSELQSRENLVCRLLLEK